MEVGEERKKRDLNKSGESIRVRCQWRGGERLGQSKRGKETHKATVNENDYAQLHTISLIQPHTVSLTLTHKAPDTNSRR